MPLQKRTVELTSTWFGHLRGVEQADIRPEVSGKLLEQVYWHGSLCEKGEVLFRIDPATYQAAYDQAVANVAAAEAFVLQSEVADEQNKKDVERFAALEIPVGEGNVVFPEGNAARYLAAYFTDSRPRNPYEEDPWDVRCLSVSSNGDLLDGNLYRQDVLDILTQYAPHGRNDQP
jgi:hypothetical protein